MEVPDPDEGMKDRIRTFEIYLQSPGVEHGQVDIYLVMPVDGDGSWLRNDSLEMNRAIIAEDRSPKILTV